jgi:carbonic anhydrase
MKRHEQILLENKAWSTEKIADDPEFFSRMAKTQTPDFLWIGCSDSRVSPTEITQTKPGELFIHRNVANLVVYTDMNLLSVLEYAVDVLKIKHVIVCGHYGCGGVKAALSHSSYGTIDKWLRHIKDVYRLHKDDIESITNEDDRVARLVEHNVREQLLNLAKTETIQRAWKNHQRPALHGWVYDLNDGIINPLLEIAPGDKLSEPIYQYDDFRTAE